MTTRNEITGDLIASKGSTDAYRAGWDRIFGKKPTPVPVEVKIEIPEDTVVVNAQLEADKLRAQWWKFCQSSSTIPTFADWYRDHSNDKNTPD